MGRRKKRRRKPWLPEDTVVWMWRAKRCRECRTNFKPRRTLVTFGDRRRKRTNAVCLACSGLDDRAFVPAGNNKLTRRASKYSAQRAVVVGKPKKYITRYGILVEHHALERALRECDCPAPEGCRTPIADTRIVLPPRLDAPPVASSAKPTQAPSTEHEAPANDPAPTDNYGDVLPDLILEAFPDCRRCMARRVTNYILNSDHDLPPPEHLTTSQVGPLISSYLRRRLKPGP